MTVIARLYKQIVRMLGLPAQLEPELGNRRRLRLRSVVARVGLATRLGFGGSNNPSCRTAFARLQSRSCSKQAQGDV